MMKANEITIGAQFTIATGTVYEEDVTITEAARRTVGVQGWDGTCGIPVDIEALDPIPITEELLLANGFKKLKVKSLHLAYLEKEVGDFVLTFQYGLSNMVGRDWSLHVDNGDMETVAECDMQFVHQAQALMAILGVELEFNIKKEK